MIFPHDTIQNLQESNDELCDLLLKMLKRLDVIEYKLHVSEKMEEVTSKDILDASAKACWQKDGKQLRALRKEFGLTQIELADRAKCNVKTIIRLEKGGVPRKSTVIPNIKNVFNEIRESYVHQREEAEASS